MSDNIYSINTHPDHKAMNVNSSPKPSLQARTSRPQTMKTFFFLFAFLFAGCGKGINTRNYLTPGEINGIQLWLDASFYRTLGASDGTDIFTQYGTGHTWNGANGFGFSISLTTGTGADPMFRENRCPKGHPSVDFSNASFYENTSFNLSQDALTGVTIFAILSHGTDIAQGHLGITSSLAYTGADQFIKFGQGAASFTTFEINDGATTASVQFAAATDFRTYQLWWSQPEGLMEVVEIAGDTLTRHATNTSISSISPNGFLQIGYNINGYSNAEICEIIAFNRALDPEEIENMQTYINEKY